MVCVACGYCNYVYEATLARQQRKTCGVRGYIRGRVTSVQEMSHARREDEGLEVRENVLREEGK